MVFVTGDLHGNFERFKPKYFPEQAQMTKQDIMICTGDFGGVWFGDSRDDETLDWLERLPFTLAFVCGNHENYDALERYPVAEWHGGKIHRIRPHVLHLMRGQICELEGCRFFTMGGAKSHDIEDGILEPDAPDFERRLMTLQRKPRARYRVNHISWWAQELPSDGEYTEARRNLDAVGWQVDYIITHCAPTSIALMGTRHNEADRLTDFLQEVRERAKYHYWLFGHYHDNKAIDETVVLLSKGEVDSKKIRVEFSLEDMDMSEFQDGATYPQIKEYVLEHTGLKVSNLYISQIKRKCGIEVGKNYNLPKSEDSRQPQCPPEKEKAIREAFNILG